MNRRAQQLGQVYIWRVDQHVSHPDVSHLTHVVVMQLLCKGMNTR